VTERPRSEVERTAHWNDVYTRVPSYQVSWFETHAITSLELFDDMGVSAGDAVIDAGGGASVLVAGLLDKGYSDLTVLDISSDALTQSRERVGTSAAVSWICADLLTWEVDRPRDVWHDRAVFHFLRDDEIEAYARTLREAVAPGGALIMGVFAPDGPTHCSGLPVERYSADELLAIVGNDFSLVTTRNVVHTTPNGAAQSFTWIGARKSE